MPRETRLSVIGSGRCDQALAARAEELGGCIARRGWTLVCGGLGGVMEAAARGARAEGGATIGILPGAERDAANPHIGTAIVTGMGQMRNALVVLNGDAAIAVGGGHGTLSEIALALKSGRTVIALEGWANVAGVVPARDAAHAVELAAEALAGDEH